MTNLLLFELAVILIGCGLTATVIVLRAGLPSLARRVDAAAEGRSALRRFLLGLLNGPTLLLLAMALGSTAAGQFASLFVLTAVVALAVWGLLAAVPRLGRRILGRNDASELASTLAGGITLTAAFLLPFLGWIVFAAALLVAIGTGVSALFMRRRP